VREVAFKALGRGGVTEPEARRLEEFLQRKTNDLRRGVLGLLRKQPDAEALASADRLLAAQTAPQRLAGLELLRQLTEAGRVVEPCRARAAAYRDRGTPLTEAEQKQIETILKTG
jgi:hypothetical protein